MCGRTTLTITPEDLERTFGFPVPPGYRPRFNIAPSQELLVLRDAAEGVRCQLLRWGLVPFWADSPSIGHKLINARAESIATKPAFRAAFARRRCLIVVDGFYEWQVAVGGKRPYRVCLRNRGAFTLAGVWERWDRGPTPLESCTIITTSANSVMAPIHDRMPVVVPEESRDLWLAANTPQRELEPLLVSYGGSDLEAYEVSTRVNSPANDLPDCLEPLAPPPTPQ